MERQTFSEGVDCQLSLSAAVNAVVVQDQMDVFCVGIVTFHNCPHLIDKQLTVLVITFNECHFASMSIQCSRQIMFLVLAGSEYRFLHPTRHPVVPDFGIQMNVDFIHVEDNLAFRKRIDQPL